ncbi:unnamed protein product [Didymodactylos carnosus]|uniref:Kinesin light chain n=1 Tax=Didymodactylos carnosus TaxID=1234261 RepID=A0A8S2FBQ5_9BILA|nr:unnamed protein product [Didymodactylos carnosus]CAF4216807.1 unnamed protein product [Didymodactylos carnosus]
MAENNLLQSTKCLLKDLDAIKNNVTFTSASSEQSVISSKSMELIELSIDEARLMMEFSDYLQKFEMEKHQLQKEVKRLYKENSFLRDELKRTTKNLSTYEQMNSEHIVEIEHLKFLHDVNKYDTSVESLEDEDVNDLFPSSTPATDDDNYPLADVSMITSESAISPSSLSDEFVPSRAQTIRSLVLQYASKQRYEVAIPLCKQTIQDLERTVGHVRTIVCTFELSKKEIV